MENKICKVCKKELSLSNFFKDSVIKDGYRNKCKSCTKKGLRIIEKPSTKSYSDKLNAKYNGEYSLVGKYHKDEVSIIHNICCKIRKTKPKNGLIRGCPNCKRKTSFLHRMFESYLKYNNIEYECEFKDSRCKNVKELPFDFAIKKEGILKCLVEIDGEQHYKGNGRFDTGFIQFKDNIKTDFCKDNNIRLYRIKYDDSKLEMLFSNILEECKFHVIPNFKFEDLNYDPSYITNIRNLYLKHKSIRKLSAITGESFPKLLKIIRYEIFLNQDGEIKDKILEIYDNTKNKTKDIMDSDIPKIITMLEEDISLTKIAKRFGISRKNKKLLELGDKIKVYEC